MTIHRRNRPWWAPGGLIISCRSRLPARASGGDREGASEANPKTDLEVPGSNVSSGEGYVGLFVRMLGLDNDPLDREQAIVTLWKYSQGGKSCIDRIMRFPGCITLVVSLLKSDSSSTCEAAAGLLRTLSSVNIYRDILFENGAVEEISSLLCQSSLTSEVKEQSLCTLWNLSIDEKPRVKLANDDFLPLLVKFLDDEDIKVKEAAGGILANLSLSPCNHSLLVEAGVIPKLADILKGNVEGSKVIRKEAKTALLELAKDEYYRILITEEGLVRVPVIGAAAYKSFRSLSHSWPSLPDGTQLQKSSRPSRYGASELLLGLNAQEKNFSLEEAKMIAIVGRSQQQFLARIGAIEVEDGRSPPTASLVNQQYTILPWVDGVARLVLILGLEDVSAITRSAYSIAHASINEHMRIAFKESGAVKPLVQLLCHDSESLQEAVAHALERLSVSYEVCQTIESEGVLSPLITILKNSKTSRSLLEKTVSILFQIFDLGKEMKRTRGKQVVNGSNRMLYATSSSAESGHLKTIDAISISEVTERKKIIDSGIISLLINMLRTSSPTWQIKAASILEYTATFEPHAATIAASDIEAGLDAVFQQVSSGAGTDGTSDDELKLDAVKAEEIGLAIAATARLLTKLLNLEQFLSSIDATHFVLVLRNILKSSIPLHSKNWVAACLVKLESLVSSDTELEKPIDMEVTIYETIPRLVEQMATAFSLDVREAAALELNHVIARGGVECTRAVAAAGGIFPLVKLLDEGNGEASAASLAILYNLGMDTENHPAIVAAGAVPLLKRIVLSEGPQWTRALTLLRNLPT